MYQYRQKHRLTQHGQTSDKEAKEVHDDQQRQQGFEVKAEANGNGKTAVDSDGGAEEGGASLRKNNGPA